MKKREVAACLLTSLLVLFYSIELIFQWELETFFPPLHSGSFNLSHFTTPVALGPSPTQVAFTWHIFAAMITGKLIFVFRNVIGCASISPFTPEFVCPPLSLRPQPRSHVASGQFQPFRAVTTQIFFFCRCVRFDWPIQSSQSLARRL